MPRMGRPKVDNPKSKALTIRLDADTEDLLNEYCIFHKVTKGEAVRRAIILLSGKK